MSGAAEALTTLPATSMTTESGPKAWTAFHGATREPANMLSVRTMPMTSQPVGSTTRSLILPIS